MKKKYNLRKLNRHKSYSSQELQEVLGVHGQTIKTWKREGLKPLEGGNSPFYYSGDLLINFLTQRMKSQKVTLQKNEFYCLKCRKAVVPLTIETINRKIKIGNNKESIFTKGNCPFCNKEVMRFGAIEIGKSIKFSAKEETEQLGFKADGWN